MPKNSAPAKVHSGMKSPDNQAIAVEPPATPPVDDVLVDAVQRLSDSNKGIAKSCPEERIFHSRYRALRVQIEAGWDQVDPATGRRTQVKGLAAQFKPEGGSPVGVFRVKPCQTHRNMVSKPSNCCDCHYLGVIASLEASPNFGDENGALFWDAELLQVQAAKASQEHAIQTILAAPRALKTELLSRLGVEFTPFPSREGEEQQASA